MTESAAASETPFWRFSLHFYRQAGVAEACIALQDECGVDVNLLLFLLWLAAGRRQLSAANVKDLDAAVGDWRQLTIVPISMCAASSKARRRWSKQTNRKHSEPRSRPSSSRPSACSRKHSTA